MWVFGQSSTKDSRENVKKLNLMKRQNHEEIGYHEHEERAEDVINMILGKGLEWPA